MFDDSDIKIFTSKADAATDMDILSVVESLNQQRANGNVGKAENLGYSLASLAFSDESREKFQNSTFFAGAGAEVAAQIGVLLLFAAEAALNYFLPSTQLSTIAITALHKHLDELESDFYRNVVESSAYSFYYLSIRKGGEDVSTDIGKAFAMLCQKEGNTDYVQAGRNLYNMVLTEVQQEVTDLAFQE